MRPFIPQERSYTPGTLVEGMETVHVEPNWNSEQQPETRRPYRMGPDWGRHYDPYPLEAALAHLPKH